MTVLAAACGGDLDEPGPPSGEEDPADESPVDPDEPEEEEPAAPPPLIDEFPPAPALVDAQLDVDGDALVLTVENLTGATATVSLGATVENPDALYATADAGGVVLAAYESAEIVLAAPAVAGLERLGQGWTDARVSVQAELDDGRTWGTPLSLFVENGRAVAPRPVVASGVAHGFTRPAEPAAGGEPRGGTFRMCFANVVTHSGVFEGSLDFHRGTSQFVFAAGMRVVATQPNGTALAARFLDFDGCTVLPRVTGTWSFQMSLQGRDFPIAGVTMVARTTASAIPQRTVTQVVGATGDPARLPFTMAAGQDAQLQTAFSAVLHTALRATSLGAVVSVDALTIQMGTATNYNHATGTIQVTPTSATSRFSVSHETGHWLHFNFRQSNFDYTYCAAGDAGCTPPAPDDCSRTPNNTHGMLTVEWNSTAHIEGLATFFSAVAFNNATSGADCFLPDTNNLSCESEGKTLETGLTGNGPCFEWFDNMFFSTGVEHDWTKMYWDFVADERQNFVTYLNNERNLTGLTRSNRGAKIFEGLPQAMNQALRRAAIGNIQEGAAH